MKGDFTRVSFDPRNHFSGVFQQQGRVTLDADVNENTAILLHHIRTLTRDLFGPHGGPADGNGFLLAVDSSGSTPRLTISAGHYYVDGLLCEAETPCDYAEQPDWLPPPPDDAGAGGDPLLAWLASANRSPDQRFWVYVDVWERHVSWIEDERIREAALGGPDTCTRAKLVWQVKALPWDPAWSSTANRSPCLAPMVALSPLGSARMAAQLDPGQQIADPCTISPESRYRGAENQLYRVEIHHGGDASAASFKWSRDNGSVATRWLSTDGTDLVVKSARGFSAGDWVELSHDALDLAGLPGQLLRLSKVQGDRLTPDPASAGGDGVLAWSESFVNPKLRRWDQRGNDDVVLSEGAVPIDESSTTEPGWIALEDGIQVRFEAGGVYRPGDYWLIPARVASQDIAWPLDAFDQAAAVEPLGILHHYAPLGVVSMNDGFRIDACRRCVEIPETACRVPAVVAADGATLPGVPTRPGTRSRLKPVAAVKAKGKK